MTKVDITYTCANCGDAETVEARFGDSTDDDTVIPVGWGMDDEGNLLCEDHYSEWEDAQQDPMDVALDVALAATALNQTERDSG